MFRRKQTFYVNARAIIEREGRGGHEVLLQIRNKPGEAKKLEFPGGRLEAFESIPDALRREICEETGLTVTRFLSPLHETRGSAPEGDAECLHPSFVYQTLRGPVDSIGFFFRVQAEGKLTGQGDQAERHEWISLHDLRQRFEQRPDDFNWLTRGALTHDLRLQEIRI